jgi:RNA polymerase sigma-70 factor (ECF subfamily)
VSLDALPIEFDESGHFREPFREAPRPPEAAAAASEVDARVREAIAELPDGYREAVVLTDLEGLPYAESAALLGLGLAAFKTRLHRARLHLRNRLDALWKSISGSPGGRP